MKKLIGEGTFQLDWTQVKKIGIFLLITLAGATLTAVSAFLSDSSFSVMVYGKELNLTVLVMAFWSTIAEVLRRFLTNYAPVGKKK